MLQHLQREMITEIRYHNRGVRRFVQRMRIFTNNPNWDMRSLSKRGYGVSFYDFKGLERAYRRICRRLNASLKETAPTYAEIQFRKMLKSKTRLKFYTNFWILNRNVDFFFPSLATLYPRFTKGFKLNLPRQMRALAIEIDGDIHNEELKIKKDESRDEVLLRLMIGVTTVKNEDLRIRQIDGLLSAFKRFKPLCTNSKRRILSKIYFYTILYHATPSELKSLFNKDFPEN